MTRKFKILALVAFLSAPVVVLGAPAGIDTLGTFIANLPALSTITGSETIPVAQNGVTRALPLAALQPTLGFTPAPANNPTFSGVLKAPSVTVNGDLGLSGGLGGSNTAITFGKVAGAGYGRLVPGTATRPGYMDFYGASGTRLGYVGYTDANGNLQLSGPWARDTQPAVTSNDGTVATTMFGQAIVANLKAYVLGLLQANYTLQVPNVATLRGLVGFSGVTVHRSGYGVPGDGGAADYAFNTTACGTDDGGSCVNAAGGGSWKIDWSSVGFTATPNLFVSNFGSNSGAVDTAAVQAALATMQPRVRITANFALAAPLYLTTHGQLIEGDGIGQTFATIPVTGLIAGANPTLGAFAYGSYVNGTFVPLGEPGPIVRGITVLQSNPSALTTYPPVFYAHDTPRSKWIDVGCYFASGCWDVRGQSGGDTWEHPQFSGFRYGIWIDGAADTMRINAPHCFPFGMGASQQAAFFDQGTALVGAVTGNTGNGTIGLSAHPSMPGAIVGAYKATFTSATAYRVTDPNGTLVGTGTAGGGFFQDQVGFAINVGSTPFVAGDAFNIVVNSVPAACVWVGRGDDVKISNGLFLSGVGLSTYTGTTGSSFGSIVNTDWDTSSGTLIMSGQWTDTGGQATQAFAGAVGGFVGGTGMLSIANKTIGTAVAQPTGGQVVQIGGILDVTATDFGAGALDTYSILQWGGFAKLTGNQFERTTTGANAQPAIYHIGGTFLDMGNALIDTGTGSGPFIKANTDSAKNIATLNTTPQGSWTYAFAGTAGLYQNNR